MPNHSKIAIYTTDVTLQELVAKKSIDYKLPVTDTPEEYDYILQYQACAINPGYICKLHKPGRGVPGPVFIDFCAGRLAHRRLYGGGRKQVLARAIGLKPGYNPTVLDVTAGLGRDAFVLASLGCKMILLERNPLVYEILNNGLQRAQQDPAIAEITKNIKLMHIDAAHYLKQISGQPQADVIYLDPMYPARSKSAQVKKEMAFLHDIVGTDHDSAAILHIALASCIKRVVVKRPGSAQVLADMKPATSISSKNTRYDIYI